MIDKNSRQISQSGMFTERFLSTHLAGLVQVFLVLVERHGTGILGEETGNLSHLAEGSHRQVGPAASDQCEVDAGVDERPLVGLRHEAGAGRERGLLHELEPACRVIRN